MKRMIRASISWNSFDRFIPVINKYMPDEGEGNTLASQLVTAINRLVYRYYNDGDVFDNRILDSYNDLSNEANWIYRHFDASGPILRGIEDCYNKREYEEILYKLADTLLDAEDLEKLENVPKSGSIYDCDGPFYYEEYNDEDDDDEYFEYGDLGPEEW